MIHDQAQHHLSLVCHPLWRGLHVCILHSNCSCWLFRHLLWGLRGGTRFDPRKIEASFLQDPNKLPRYSVSVRGLFGQFQDPGVATLLLQSRENLGSSLESDEHNSVCGDFTTHDGDHIFDLLLPKSKHCVTLAVLLFDGSMFAGKELVFVADLGELVLKYLAVHLPVVEENIEF
ncbi:hypothetical protein HG530_002579 [Fusarium avenaceum]|nr:hypothetical protein HG530_002579 [Fusarium avenaceum]